MRKVSRMHIRISENIRSIRKQKGLSQEELALKAGINRAYVGYIERGERNPTLETLNKIARGLKVRLSEIVK